MRRWLTRIVLALVGAYVLFLVVANVLLMTGAAPALIESAQENVRMRWDHAYSWFPGRITAEGFVLVSQDTSVELEVTAERTTATLGLMSFFHKTVTISDADSKNLTFRLRGSRSLKELCKAKPHALPDIGELARPRGFSDEATCLQQKDTQMIDPEPTDPSRLWGVKLDHVAVERLREVWIEDVRFIGDISGINNFEFHPLVSLTISDSTLDVNSGGLLRANKVLATNLSAKTRTSLGPIGVEREVADRILTGLSSEVTAGAELASFAFLDTYLKGIGQLSFGEGRGRVEARVLTKDGTLLPGTRAKVDGDRLVARIHEHRAIGKGRFVAEVNDREILELTLALDKFDVRRTWDKKATLLGTGLKIDITSKKPKLASPFHRPDLSISLTDLTIPDVSLYNGYLPSDSPLSLVRGDAHLKAELVVKNGDQLQHGNITLRTGEVHAKYKNLEMRTRFTLDAPITRADLEHNSCALDGAKLELAAPDSNWWANVECPSLTLAVPKTTSKKAEPKPLEVHARMKVAMANMRPVLDVFHAAQHIPGIVKRLIPGRADGTLKLDVADGGYGVKDLDFSAGPLTARGKIERRDGTTNGDLLLSYLGIKATVQIKNDESHLALFSSGSATEPERRD